MATRAITFGLRNYARSQATSSFTISRASFRNPGWRASGVAAYGKNNFSQARSLATIKYQDSHEYVRLENGIGTIGITDYAQGQLGDVVFVDLPEVGDKFEQGDTFGSVESVKAASDVYLPVSGEIVEVNDKLLATPELVNSHALTDAWFVKVKLSNEAEMGSLLTEEQYKKVCEEGSDK